MSNSQLEEVAQLSGTAVAAVADLRQESLDNRLVHVPLGSAISSDEEQALESHEVIELQTFSERKVWIEEKIKFLEQMAPVEVFAGLDAVRASAERVPGVPTANELKQWITEHDAIEKETEIFDRGELTKLRQLTKAAAQRNLSTADTDLIELALTTIYELDKLLHLLRDRSENLELLATRLSWEETRIAAWVDRRTILEDLQTFLDTRVRWTPSVYESVSMRGDETPDLKRRSSIASLASASSDTSSSSFGLSRGARFKLAESLSHDAAQFAGRVTSLRHGKISAAGKILDKLIDQSRKPVPDELLDEQDKLEEQGIAEMENLGKADEIYVETMMDKTTAQNLFEEIETAKLHHPTARQSASFISRADALIRRLVSRGNPASFTSTFPFPEHPLFIDQRNSNQMLAQFLSSEIVTTSTIARKADDAAKAYRTAFEAVKRIEDLTTPAQEFSDTLSGILAQLQGGILAAEGDSSPPNLTSTNCLELNKHSAFLALFPTILQQFSHTAEKSKQILRHSVPAMLDLDHPGVDEEFTNTARSYFRELEITLNLVQAASEDMTARCERLTEARRLNNILKETMNSLEDIERRISASIETQRWRRVTALPSQVHSVYPQPSLSPPTGASHAEYVQELLRIDYYVDREVDGPLRLLVETLEDPLKLYLTQQSSVLRGFMDNIEKQGTLLGSIQRQTAMIKAVYEEFRNVQRDIEVLKNRFQARTQEILSDEPVNGSVSQGDADLQTDFNATQAEVTRYVNRLSDRILFVSQNPSSTSTHINSNASPLEKNQPASLDSKFDLPALDSAVRADSNSFAMTLSVHVEELNQYLVQYHLAGIAKEVDVVLVSTAAHIDRLIGNLVTAKFSLSETSSGSDDITLPLDTLFRDIEQVLQHDNTHIERSVSQARDLLQKMDAVSKAKDISAHEALYTSRFKSFNDVAAHHKTWERDARALLDEIRQKYTSEIKRIAEEQRQQAERDQDEAGDAERLRMEQELEKEKNAQDLLKQGEGERHVAERAQMKQTSLGFEENSVLEDEPLSEKCPLSENDQGDYPMKERVVVKNLGTKGSWRSQVDRLDEEMRGQIEKDAMSEEAESYQEEERVGLDSGERCAAKQLRRFEDEEVCNQSESGREATKGIQTVSSEEERTCEQVQQRDDGKAASKEIHRLDTQVEDQVASKVIVDSDPSAWNTAQKAKRDYLQTEPASKDGLRNEDCIPIGQHLLDDNINHLSGKSQENIISIPSLEPYIAQGQTRVLEIKDRPVDKTTLASHQTKSGQRQTEDEHRDQSLGLHRSLKRNCSTNDSTSSPTSYRPKTRSLIEEDVFGLHITSRISSKRKEMHDLQAQILAFRRRLRSMNINEIARPRKSSSHLPDMDQSKKMAREFSRISSGVSLLPRSATDSSVDVELRSLRTELEGSAELLKKVEELARLAEDVQKCDVALSDLLEHIDSYPASPKAVLSSSHMTLLEATPEERLTARIAFTRSAMEIMITNFAGVSTDLRAISEKTRILQTWSELEDMAHDLLGGWKSRSASAISSRPSSRRNSGVSNTQTRTAQKTSPYSNLIVSSTSPHPRLSLPQRPNSRRAVSGGPVESQSRPVSQLSNLSSNRAVSGPFRASVYSSTFASRQRTSSLSNSHSSPTVPSVHSRAQTAQHSRVASPTGSDVSSYSRPIHSHTRSSTSVSGSSWARAPRNSLSSIAPSPKNRSVIPRKTYVADPKNKLDVAVGDVVNKLPVDINVEGVAETWKDQSGKYWIGNQDPKLCFCRILRSQTVMVRVGGGWSELSKFIRDHFADSFCLLPESPPRFGSSEEKWISSSTLVETPAEIITPPVPPRTPEPTVPFMPSFSISTPNGKSPRSLHSASNSPSTKGSPLTPLQFIRRADVDSILRPGTPSKPPTTLIPRGAMTQTHTLTRNSIWRP
ncbi:hypothetical protein C0995_013105 [Termitomyces sp. Mi166|nr:hypothetical protein C0995_013105 [Termitomyces sp. Mi166\